MEQVLACLATLASERGGAYAITQVGEIAAAQRDTPAPAAIHRSPRHYMKPLERRLGQLDVPARMELDRLGRLLVEIDEFYDDSCLVLRRLGELSLLDLEEARARFPHFLLQAYQEYAVASFDAHLVAVAVGEAPPPPKDRGSGLLELLPELLVSLE